MFLHLSVILITGEGGREVSLLWTETILDRDTLDRDPQTETPPRQSALQDYHLVATTEAGGNYPTGMHTCLMYFYSIYSCEHVYA